MIWPQGQSTSRLSISDSDLERRIPRDISLAVVQGLLNRWTSQYDWGITTGGLTFNLNNGTKSHLIIVKLLENTFLGMTKVRDWPILTLAMLSVKTEQIQNFALFWDCCKRSKSVVSGILSKNCCVWAALWPTSSELKINCVRSLDSS